MRRGRLRSGRPRRLTKGHHEAAHPSPARARRSARRDPPRGRRDRLGGDPRFDGRDQRLLRELERQAPRRRRARGLRRAARARSRSAAPRSGTRRADPTSCSSSNTTTTLATLALPAGKYLVHGKLDIHTIELRAAPSSPATSTIAGDRGLLGRVMEPDRGGRRAGSRRGDRTADAPHARVRRGHRADVHRAGQRLADADASRDTSSSTRFASTASSSSSSVARPGCDAAQRPPRPT